MKVSITWAGDVTFDGRTDSGHTVRMDGPPEAGGHNRGPRPMETVLLGMGACTAFDVVHILRKARQDISDCVAHVEAERAPVEPKVFTRIHVHFVITGRAVNPQHVERAITLSAEKYCSASIMLGKTAAITHDYEIVERK